MSDLCPLGVKIWWVGQKSIKILQQTNTAMEILPFFEWTFHDVHMWGKCSCCEFPLSVSTLHLAEGRQIKSFKTKRYIEF